MPGGNSRTTVYQSPYPIYAESGTGCWVRDVDGTERIDFVNNYTSLLHGHADPRVNAAVTSQLARGTCFSFPTELEIQLAELLSSRLASVEALRFTNSGSEAVMMAVKAARAYTNRAKIAKCEGAYHGSYDYVEVSLETPRNLWNRDAPQSIAYSKGTPQGVLDDVIVIPFNDAASAERILLAHAHELAAVLFDPVPNRAGLVQAEPAFVRTLRDITARHGIVLIADEVITFRLGFRGAQHEFGFAADLTTLGKIIGGGFPIGAVGGRRDIMSVFDPTVAKTAAPHGGTFNANPISMVAGLTALEMMTPERFDEFNALGERTRIALREAIARSGFPAQVTGAGSLFRIHMTDREISDYRSSNPAGEEKAGLAFLNRFLLNHGFALTPTGLGALSTPMTERDVDSLATAVEGAMRAWSSSQSSGEARLANPVHR